MFELSVTREIAASHQLKDYTGPCSRLHGHNWKIRVTVVTDTLDAAGISIDLEELDKLLWQVIGKFDHNHFNSIAPFTELNPSAENISRYVFEQVSLLLPAPARLKKVILWENDRYLVSYVP
jgi:6-pyruvoyltetrahydropterin/6-carboxytetrahydropterin synthase